MSGRLTSGLLRWNEQANNLDPIAVVRFITPRLVSDVYYGGPGSITGSAAFIAGSGPGRVYALDPDSLVITREARVNAGGAYTLPNLRTDREVIVMGVDQAHTVNPVAVDNVTPTNAGTVVNLAVPAGITRTTGFPIT